MLSVFFIVCACVDMCYKIVLKMCLNMYIICIYLWCVLLLGVVAVMFFWLFFELIDIWLIFMLVSIVKNGK